MKAILDRKINFSKSLERKKLLTYQITEGIVSFNLNKLADVKRD